MRVPVRFLRPIELPPDGAVRVRNTPGDSIGLHALAPDMIPPPADLRDKWKGGRGFAPYLMFQIKAALPDLTETYLASVMRQAIADGLCRAEKPGDVCPDPRNRPGRDAREAIFTGIGHEFAFCTRPGGVPVPHCETERLLFDGVFIRTSFDRRLLDVAEPVWQRVYDLVCSWVEVPAGRPPAINNCRTRAARPPR